MIFYWPVSLLIGLGIIAALCAQLAALRERRRRSHEKQERR